jgi:hypothetical protein
MTNFCYSNLACDAKRKVRRGCAVLERFAAVAAEYRHAH